MNLSLCLYIPMHHLRKAVICLLAQLSFVFFYKCPEFICLERTKFYLVQEQLVYRRCMLCQVIKEAADCVSVMAGYSFHRANSVLLYDKFAEIDYFVFSEVFSVKWTALCFHKKGSAVFAKIPLMACPVFSSFDYVFACLFEMIIAIWILANDIDFSAWS